MMGEVPSGNLYPLSNTTRFRMRLFDITESRWYLYVSGRWRPEELPSAQFVNHNGSSGDIGAIGGVWENVPSLATITLDLPAPLSVEVTFGAVVYASSGYTMIGVATTGALVSDGNYVLGLSPVGSGAFGQHAPFSSVTVDNGLTAFKLLDLPAGVTTIRMMRRRSTTGAVARTNYPTLLVKPLKWE